MGMQLPTGFQRPLLWLVALKRGFLESCRSWKLLSGSSGLAVGGATAFPVSSSACVTPKQVKSNSLGQKHV